MEKWVGKRNQIKFVCEATTTAIFIKSKFEEAKLKLVTQFCVRRGLGKALWDVRAFV
jgi:hypothetical protein